MRTCNWLALIGAMAGVWGLTAAAPSADAAPALANFTLVNHIPSLSVAGLPDTPTNFSGVAYNYDTGRLYIIDNGFEAIRKGVGLGKSKAGEADEPERGRHGSDYSAASKAMKPPDWRCHRLA